MTAYRPGPEGNFASADIMDRTASDLTFPAEWAAERKADLALA